MSIPTAGLSRFQARFDSRCSVCSKPTPEGDYIYGTKGPGGKWLVYCEECGKEISASLDGGKMEAPATEAPVLTGMEAVKAAMAAKAKEEEDRLIAAALGLKGGKKQAGTPLVDEQDGSGGATHGAQPPQPPQQEQKKSRGSVQDLNYFKQHATWGV